MNNFYNTLTGRNFFDINIPKILKSLEMNNLLKIFDLSKNNKIELSEKERKIILDRIRDYIK